MSSGMLGKQLYIELVFHSALRKVKVWGFGLPRGLIQWQESQKEHTPPGRGALAGILVVIIVTNGSV